MARILVIEDDDRARELYREMLERAGYDVVCAVARRPDSPPVMVLSLDSILEKVHRSALSQSRQGLSQSRQGER